MHFVITDSGLGGLGICAAIENAFRRSGSSGDVRLTYFNAWPEQGLGYNSMPEEATRVAAFDRALARMSQLGPDRIVIACNTLSVLFPLTRFARTSAIPVIGIIDAGVALFEDALTADAASSIALFGTRITMESGVHRARLAARGIAPDRIVPVSSHGLAAAIEIDPAGADVHRLIGECASTAAASLPPAGPVLAGLCCTHYGYVADQFRAALEGAVGRPVRVLDPNGAMARMVAPVVADNATIVSKVIQGGNESPTPRVTINVLSKVTLDDSTREGIGRLVAPVSPATARALESYTHVPDLF